MNNKVFYQHPNLMRVLGMHETVMEVMVNVLGGDKNKVLFFFNHTASKVLFLFLCSVDVMFLQTNLFCPFYQVVKNKTIDLR